MKTIFTKNDFTLCYVPVPKEYPQSQTHSGIAYVPKKLGGYQYWLITSPYPNIKRPLIITYLHILLKKIFGKALFKEIIGEDFENPMLYFANNKSNGLPPTEFIPYPFNPLMNKPTDKYGLGSFCSDPDIFILKNKFFILNRETIRKSFDQRTGKLDYILRINLINGSIKDDMFHIINIESKFDSNDNAISPCLTYFQNKYRYLYLVTNSYNTGGNFQKLVLRSDQSIEGKFDDEKIINVDNGKYEPWHFSVFQHMDKLYAIVACILKGQKGRCYQMFGEFDDSLERLTIFQKPLTEIKSYRGSACVREDGMFVLYSSTVNENLKGSKSVDGRDIIMAHMPFESLLSKVKNNL